jgi:hypothetical protein
MMERLGLTRDQVGQLHQAMMELIAATKAAAERDAGAGRRDPGGT